MDHDELQRQLRAEKDAWRDIRRARADGLRDQPPRRSGRPRWLVDRDMEDAADDGLRMLGHGLDDE